MRILVFGGSGLLGAHLVKFFRERKIFYIKLGYQNNCDKKVNLGDVNEVYSVIKKKQAKYHNKLCRKCRCGCLQFKSKRSLREKLFLC